MSNFWDANVWGAFNLMAVILIGLIAASLMKKMCKPIRDSLIPTSVLGGIFLLSIAGVYNAVTDKVMFDTTFYGGNGVSLLEIITYHMLALGFIASTFCGEGGQNNTRQRRTEILNTGITTVATYLLQGVLGMGITIFLAGMMDNVFSASGLLLPFGYGQGTGQALNYGNIYETDYGFVGGKTFGLTLAALGFLSASIGGVCFLTVMKRKNKLRTSCGEMKNNLMGKVNEKEIPLFESMDTLSVQVALLMITYLLTYCFLSIIGNLLPGMKSVIYGFNFLVGVLMATVVKKIVEKLYEKKILKQNYISGFMMTRIRNFFFDIMVVAGIAAIRLSVVENYVFVIAILAVAGAVFTFLYLRFVSKKLFPEYEVEQFVAMYGMLTGTASTGIILLREVDAKFETPAADNMVYQNFPAIVLGFPLMILATMAPTAPKFVFLMLLLFFILLNLLLFRKMLFSGLKK